MSTTCRMRESEGNVVKRLKSGKKPETELRKPVIQMLRNDGALVTPYVGSTMGQSGTADVHIVSSVFSGWVEFKGEDTPREPLQEKFVRDCVSRGYPAVFLRLHHSGPRFYSGVFEWEACQDAFEAEIARASCINVPTSWFNLRCHGKSGASLLLGLAEWWKWYGKNALNPERLD